MHRLRRESTLLARAFRHAPTPAERALWKALRSRALMGAKFRRQHPIGPFVVDFYCVEAWLVVEADGAPHFPRPLRDVARDHWLQLVGHTVLRFPNHQILDDLPSVLEAIRRALAATPLPSGEGTGVRANGSGGEGR